MIRRALLTIAHRLALALLAALAFASPAGAVEVARIDGASLYVSEQGRADFCVRVETSGPRSGGSSAGCRRAPWRPRRSIVVTTNGDDRVVVGGAVPTAIARAEAEIADGRRIAFDTVPGPGYRGRYAGRVRFFLAELPVSDPSDDEAGGLLALRFFDAGGTLQGADAGDADGRQIGPTQRLLRERGRGASIFVLAEVRRRHAPTPLELDRFEDQTCLLVRTRSGSGGDGVTTACREAGPNRPLLTVFPEGGCGALRTVVTGFVGDAVSAVRLRLGSGRVKVVPARALPGGARYVATVVPRGEAVRRVDAIGATAGYELGEPPSGLPCVEGDGAFGIGFAFDFGLDGPSRPPGPADQVAAEAAGRRLLVRDAEEGRLCAGLDRLLADGSDCRRPPVTADEAFSSWDGRVVSAMLPAEVARVRLPGGRELPTSAGGYTGRYASTVRFLFTEVDTPATGGIRLLDSAGGVIGTLAGRVPPPSTRIRLAGGRGWRFAASRYDDNVCIELRLGGDRPDCEVSAGDDAVVAAVAAVGCNPRVAVIHGTLDRRTRLRVVLRGGRTLRPRVLRIPRRLGGGRVFALELPRRAEVKALRLDRRRVTFPLLPAARQCGYRLSAPFLGPLPGPYSTRSP